MAEQLKLDDLQSYCELFAPAQTSPAPRVEQRQSARRQVAVDGTLMVDGTAIDIRTVDISSGGMCIRATKQLAVGKECQVDFSLVTGGAAHPVAGGVHVVYCFYTPEQDFKAGLEFLRIPDPAAQAIEQFVRA